MESNLTPNGIGAMMERTSIEIDRPLRREDIRKDVIIRMKKSEEDDEVEKHLKSTYRKSARSSVLSKRIRCGHSGTFSLQSTTNVNV